MTVTFRNYTSQALFTEDYEKVRNFLRKINQDQLNYPGFTWGRWEWLTTHTVLDRDSLDKIGLWEVDGEVAALATYESALGDAYLFSEKKYQSLQPEMLAFAKQSLVGVNGLRVIIDNNNRELQRAAITAGFIPTNEQEHTAQLDISDSLSYQLPEGYRIVSMADGWDFEKYNEVMWRGFDHEGPVPNDPEAIRIGKEMLSSPCVDPQIILAITAPNGDYVAHCGMWYTPGDNYALVEPVATDPAYRMKGLGKAVVLEAVKRCGKLGAKIALVGSPQQFYYNIGFYPISTGSWWEYKTKGSR